MFSDVRSAYALPPVEWAGLNKMSGRDITGFTCLHKMWLLQASIHLLWRDRGMTGSANDRRNNRRVAATEKTPPTITR